LEIFLSITAGNGPEECAHAAALTLDAIAREAERLSGSNGRGIRVSVLEAESSLIKGNIRSCLLSLSCAEAGGGVGNTAGNIAGNAALLESANVPDADSASEGKTSISAFVKSWTGSVQWIWQSAYRPHHKRKNWFVSVRQQGRIEEDAAFAPAFTPAGASGGADAFSSDEVRFETARSGGPGGQHVNKTETAVRAVHIPSGKSAVSRDERSQFLNKKTALRRLAALLAHEREARERESRADLRHLHYETERGNPVRVYEVRRTGGTFEVQLVRKAGHGVKAAGCKAIVGEPVTQRKGNDDNN
jgi:peptide chain release factor